MAVVTGDIIRFTMFQELLGQQVLNVDYRKYTDIGGSGNTYEELADKYQLEFTNVCGDFQTTNLAYTRILVENVSNGIEFLDRPMTDTGTVTDAVMPSYVAVPIKQVRTTKQTRNGSKRIAGIGETKVIQNTLSLAAQEKANLEALFGETMLVGDGTVVNDAELAPYIIGRTKDANGVYQIDLNKQNPVASAIVGEFISTQNSRKQSQSG